MSKQPYFEVTAFTLLKWQQEGNWKTGNGGNNEHADFLSEGLNRNSDNSLGENLPRLSTPEKNL